MFDLFISHSHEDKEALVRPLANILESRGLTVWVDEAELRPGKSLINSIDEAIGNCRFGLVVLSASFLAKQWPRRELNALTTIELAEGREVIPIWHGVTADQIRAYSAALADKIAIDSSLGVEAIADKILTVVSPTPLIRLENVSLDAEDNRIARHLNVIITNTGKGTAKEVRVEGRVFMVTSSKFDVPSDEDVPTPHYVAHLDSIMVGETIEIRAIKDAVAVQAGTIPIYDPNAAPCIKVTVHFKDAVNSPQCERFLRSGEPHGLRIDAIHNDPLDTGD